MTRRFRLLMVLTALLLAAGCTADRTVRQAPLVGAWRSSVEFKTGPFAGVKDLEFMYVFNAGGTLTESSNYDAAPPVPPAYGVWHPVGSSTFEARYEYFSTAVRDSAAFRSGAGWQPSGRGVLRERITLSPDGRTFKSTLRYESLGPQGEPVEAGGEAEGRAVRIGS